MNDNYNNYDGFENIGSTDSDTSAQSDSSQQTEYTEQTSAEQTAAEQQASAAESSYEWNAEPKADGARESSYGQDAASGEYRYSYINGRNQNADHNPNRYESAYTGDTQSNAGGYSSQGYSASPNYSSQGAYGSSQQSSPHSHYYGAQGSAYTGQNGAGYGGTPYAGGVADTGKKPKRAKRKKERKPASKGFVAAMLAVAIVLGGAAGFGGSMLASTLNSNSSSSGVNITQVSADSTSTSTTSSAALSGTTTEIVKKTADSVVEIATESVVTGGFAQQYVQTGAGSGVIISEDGYIITNQHVIDGAKTITVTLRDGSTKYTATVVGSDETNDIALLKIDATGLSPATFGDSSSLVVGDYVVAIGNPLGTLGGTVTDGIISALARQVTVDNQTMTLLQHSAQISPGNSGGGLFNANGELIGIVNAKDSATSVEGIAFAIPINNVVDILDDLKNYGYVTGQVDLGMELTDITSSDSAFYYGLSSTGCYVLSVTSGSNAEAAGFKSGDLITAVNGTSVSSKSEVQTAIADCEVGDTVTFTVSRSGRTADLQLTLAEYSPSGSSTSSGSSQSSSQTSSNNDDSIWGYMFG